MLFSRGDIIYTLMILPGILLGFVLHEFAHAITADKLGDPTPRNQGRITLDPRAHIDIIGFIMILLVGFGWAKPVMTNPRHYKKPRRDDILVSLAGPFMNLLVAAGFLLILKLIAVTGFLSNNSVVLGNVADLLSYSAQINVVLFVLNLLPIPFFDGYHVIANIFNTWKYRFFTVLEQYSTIIFILLVISRVFDKIIGIPASYIFISLYKLIIL
ncbi:peptidase M50 [Ruminiclostridium papyrosolvens DSM 2782]|uniref:Peptidase M50 n=1 Tax=Ruminiclostridium papyrosolvens DSM 2782 TaxID=588581 RepID=F1T9Y6_9FIRM|nr:site-2 protease family protein [Ruminiclostridium papyrosolvens]EGD48728.1 peptidase M50 [Ruminiclostridium papyrosolvens DSM 2782]WES32516.1 site-2 protease family protein [Ruminiclostridium papyrosolvens DSM 2782]